MGNLGWNYFLRSSSWCIQLQVFQPAVTCIDRVLTFITFLEAAGFFYKSTPSSMLLSNRGLGKRMIISFALSRVHTKAVRVRVPSWLVRSYIKDRFSYIWENPSSNGSIHWSLSSTIAICCDEVKIIRCPMYAYSESLSMTTRILSSTSNSLSSAKSAHWQQYCELDNVDALQKSGRSFWCLRNYLGQV